MNAQETKEQLTNIQEQLEEILSQLRNIKEKTDFGFGYGLEVNCIGGIEMALYGQYHPSTGIVSIVEGFENGEYEDTEDDENETEEDEDTE